MIKNIEKNGKKRKINILPQSTGLSVAMFVTIAIQEIFLLLIMMLDILPVKYAVLLIVLLLLMNVGIIKLLNSRRKGTNKRLLGLVLSVAVVNIMVMGCFYLYNTLDTFQKISEEKAQYEDYHVLVLDKSKYEKVKQIEGQTVYVVDTESKMYNEAKERLLTKVSVTYAAEDSAGAVSEHLVDAKGKTSNEVIFLSNSNYELVCEENEAFEEKTRILYTISVPIKKDDFAKRINVTEDPFNVYISGIDVWGSIDQVSRSDVNMLMTVNPQTKEILLTSIPRDSYVELNMNGQMDKLTHSGMYGIEETLATVENWLDIDINYYVRANFEMIVDLVDSIGGITVDSKFAFKSSIAEYSYVEGENQLTGMAALYFARERKSFEDEDEERVRNQQIVLKAILNKITKSKVILTNYADILDAVEDSMQTSMSQKEISSLVKMQLNDMSGWKIKTISISGDGAEKGTYSMGPGKPLFVSIPKEESVEAAKQEIHAVMYPVEEKKDER